MKEKMFVGSDESVLTCKGKCLHCLSYLCVDERHQFSSFCDWSGHDGFCCRHCKFVLEEDVCFDFVDALQVELIQETCDFVFSLTKADVSNG